MSALSLKCQDCGTQLKSAKECQEHAEVCPRMLHRLRALVLESALTADEAHEFRRVHRRDIESRVQRVWEALQVLMTPQRVEDRLKRLLRRPNACEARGTRVPARRSTTEKDLHTKRTGHANFEDKTNDESNAAAVKEHFPVSRMAALARSPVRRWITI